MQIKLYKENNQSEYFFCFSRVKKTFIEIEKETKKQKHLFNQGKSICRDLCQNTPCRVACQNISYFCVVIQRMGKWEK